jgi:hypothetical protein
MTIRSLRNALALLAATTLAAGCATDRSEPPVRVEQVFVPQPVPCPALSALGPEPAYPDTDEAIANAPSIGVLAKLYRSGRLLRTQRLAEFAAAATACKF